MIVDLSGKTAVVTGAGGIPAGKFAVDLAKAGAKVAVLDINADAAEATRAAIEREGGVAVCVGCDVLDRGSVERAEKEVHEKLGAYQILINAAGGNDVKISTTHDTHRPEDVANPDVISFFDLPAAGYNRVVNLNLMGTLIPTQVFVPRMLKEKSPCIVNISSMTSYTALTRVAAYSNAKAAINSLTQWLAVHFGETGLRVNAIAPGFIVTHMNRKMLTNPDGSLTERSKKIMAHTPMKRMGEADDLTGAILFLCDETASGYMTGVVIPVDGGFMAMPGV